MDNEQEQELSFAERFSNFTSKAVSVAPLVAALGIAVWWVFFGTIKILDIDLSITQRIGLTIVTIVMALSYRKLIASGGFGDAEKTTAYQNEFKRWRANCKAHIAEKSAIDEFVKEKCYNNVNSLIRRNLERNSLVYEDIFTEDGVLKDLNYKKNKDYKFRQKWIISKCVKMKVYVPDIFNLDSERYLGVKRRVSVREFKARTDLTNTFITTILAFFSTSIMFTFVGFSKGSWIYALFQISLWTGTGVLGRIKNYNHIMKKELVYICENSDIIEEYNGLPQDRKVELQIKAKERKIKMITMKGENEYGK